MSIEFKSAFLPEPSATVVFFIFFFFQAEDGIRDYKVTGVQTCALPISNGGHGRGAIGFQNVGDEAHGIGEIGFGRKQIEERTLGKRTVADFAATRAAQELYFADAERREVVVQHEALKLVLLEEQVEPLHVFLGAQGQSGKRLGFAARKESGTVDSGKQADFTGDQANLIEGAAIGTAAGVENIIAKDIFAEAF